MWYELKLNTHLVVWIIIWSHITMCVCFKWSHIKCDTYKNNHTTKCVSICKTKNRHTISCVLVWVYHTLLCSSVFELCAAFLSCVLKFYTVCCFHLHTQYENCHTQCVVCSFFTTQKTNTQMLCDSITDYCISLTILCDDLKCYSNCYTLVVCLFWTLTKIYTQLVCLFWTLTKIHTQLVCDTFEHS